MPTILTPTDFTKQELRNPRIHNLSTAPSSPVTGQMYYDTDDNILYWWNGSSWVSAAGGSSGIPGTIFDAKGDLITATAADTPVRKAVGADGTFLVADSGEADGLEWRTLVDADIPASIFRDSEHTDAAHNTVELNDLAAPDGDVSFGGFKLTNLGTPTAGTDATTKDYVDGVSAGLAWKEPVRAATTGNITISTALNSGDVIDGVTLANGDRVLVKDQSTASQNGIYVVSGSPARATDADSEADLLAAAVFVLEGTTNADSAWTLTTNAPITVDTTSLTFVQFSGLGQITAGAGLTKTGNTLDVGAGVGIEVATDSVGVERDNANGRVPLLFAQSVGDGSTTSFNVDHNLGSLDVVVQIFRNSDGVEVMADITRSTTNRVVVAFAVAPTSNQYRVVVHG